MMDFLHREELNNNFPDSVGNHYSLPGTKFELFSNAKLDKFQEINSSKSYCRQNEFL